MKQSLFGMAIFASLFIVTAKNPLTVNKALPLINKVEKSDITLFKVKKYCAALKPFLQKNNYSTKYCFLIDMKIPSGKKRFFVVDVDKDSIVAAGLTTHGSGSITNKDSLIFSNKEGSLATSLGKYIIGNKYNGKFGLAYKLNGLQASNSNAFERFVVLHAHACVPEQEVYPSSICASWGCPTVNPTYLQTLKKYVEMASKPVVLWIYY